MSPGACSTRREEAVTIQYSFIHSLVHYHSKYFKELGAVHGAENTKLERSSISLICVLRTLLSTTGGQQSNFYHNLIWGRALESHPGGGNGNPLQYCCLENSMDRRAWRATVHGVAKSWNVTEPTRTTPNQKEGSKKHG